MIVESAVGLKAGLIGGAAIVKDRVGIADDRVVRSGQHVARRIAERL